MGFSRSKGHCSTIRYAMGFFWQKNTPGNELPGVRALNALLIPPRGAAVGAEDRQ